MGQGRTDVRRRGRLTDRRGPALARTQQNFFRRGLRAVVGLSPV